MSIFGQKVYMRVTNKAGQVILDATGLRIDFDVRLITGFGVATVRVYNLNDRTISSLIGERDRYLTLSVSLHGGKIVTILDKYYVSNTINEVKLPDTIVSLYCYHGLRKAVLEQQVDVILKGVVSLNKMVNGILSQANFAGKVKYQSFPDGLVKYVTPRRGANLHGSVQQVLRQLGEEYNFLVYTTGYGFLLIYKPKLEQVPLTDLDKQPNYVLNSTNMRANPQLAPAQLKIRSLLDPNIEPGTIFDTTKLVTAGTNTNEQVLQLSDQFASKNIGGYTKYQTLAVQHKGSNYTGDWDTIASAVSPQTGVAMPTDKWWQNGQ